MSVDGGEISDSCSAIRFAGFLIAALRDDAAVEPLPGTDDSDQRTYRAVRVATIDALEKFRLHDRYAPEAKAWARSVGCFVSYAARSMTSMATCRAAVRADRTSFLDCAIAGAYG